ncbi:A/G-specific adenine glycosylase [Caldimonas sp. KR1-144]|uniref:A/G-specific adenine glycosylase n=1 Tax=Caldimonas sp. KR1-144 TaxID=3400911 RepID=UPI003C001E04
MVADVIAAPPRVELEREIAPRIVAWQRTHGRHDLPWQRSRDPYRVWLSEVMLQQTQVTTVLAYYDRFLARFPTVLALAEAPLDEVLSTWAGLGYYSRARNLHRCAQAVMAEHGGAFPRSASALETLPGIGRSTAAAIASFCFGERAAILDGNVKRVLTRALGFDADLAVAANERALWDRATALLPADADDMPAWTQGVMDLGATVCSARRPDCLLCPLTEVCVARAQGRVEAYPVKTRKLKRGAREHWWLWLAAPDGAVWLEQRPARGIWAGLWTLPLHEDEAGLETALRELGVHAAAEPQPTLRHALTHLDWTLHPRRVLVDAAVAARVERSFAPGRWVAPAELREIALPAPLRKLLIG